MKIAAIFAKPVDRHIEGVIKADDEASLRQEIEEYVLTNEVAKRLETFLRAYNDYQGANGVWISGPVDGRTAQTRTKSMKRNRPQRCFTPSRRNMMPCTG